MWALDKHVAYIRLLEACWGLLAGSLIIALPVIWLKIRDHVPIEDDIKFSDETVADVIPTGANEKVVPGEVDHEKVDHEKVAT